MSANIIADLVSVQRSAFSIERSAISYQLSAINYQLLMIMLDRSDSDKLHQIRQSIESRSSIDKILKLAETISLEIEDSQFPLTYGGILLACHDRIDEAISVLKLSPTLPFNRVLAEYLEDTQSFIPAATAFKSATPYNVWTKTDLYRAQMAGTLDAIASFAHRNPPPSSDRYPTIIDIGPGNGVLLVEIINRLLSIYNLAGVQIIAIEQSPEMLALTEEYCRKSLAIPVVFVPLLTLIQEIKPAQLEAIEHHQPIWFINGSLSLHHMPKEIKISTMQTLASLSTKCLISDANYNHDLPEKDSPELIQSVTESYGLVIQDVLKSSATEVDRKLCINEFLLTEAINIIKNDREHRLDYHTLIPEWEDIGEQAGWSVIQTTPTVSLEDRPFTFTMELQSKVLSKHSAISSQLSA